MYKKVFIVLVIFLMLINVCSCVPAYAEEGGVYTLKRGKVYEFIFRKKGSTVEVVFSDDVLRGIEYVYEYDNIRSYKSYGKSISWYDGYLNDTLFVYNVSGSDVTASVLQGELINLYEYDSPFSLVHYDASEGPIEFTNDTDQKIYYKEFSYNEYDNKITFSNSLKEIKSGEGILTFGKGVLLFPINTGNLQYYLTFEGVFEVRNYIRSSFFRVPPWILKTDLGGIIQALLDQLSMLLPVGLVILSVFLLISLAKYIVRSFL